MNPPDWIDSELWQEWIDYRREEKKKPASERSQRMTIKKLDRLRGEGYDANLLLECAMEREWEGVHTNDDCKTERVGDKLQSGPGRRLSAVEQFRYANSRARLRILGGNG